MTKPIKITLKCKWVQPNKALKSYCFMSNGDGFLGGVVFRNSQWFGHTQPNYDGQYFHSLSSAKAWVVKRIKEINK